MKKERQKNEIDIEKELEELFSFSKEEQDFLNNRKDEFKRDEEYDILKRKFFHELEGYDLEIEHIQIRASVRAKKYKKILSDLKKEKRKYINLMGPLFDYEEQT